MVVFIAHSLVVLFVIGAIVALVTALYTAYDDGTKIPAMFKSLCVGGIIIALIFLFGWALETLRAYYG